MLYFRHGRTLVSAENRLQGRSDHSLDEVGRRQSIEIAQALQNIDRVISSPLLRAMETAAAFNRKIKPRFFELDYGDFDGVLQSDIPEEVWKNWRSDINYCPPNDESLSELNHRVRHALDEIIDESRDQNIVVVSHVLPIKAAIAWAVGVDVSSSWQMLLDRGPISRIEVSLTGPKLRGFNDTPHLLEL
ncbi:MAG: histidine phosphatase family protein [Acidimicrobiaceae bacterium]